MADEPRVEYIERLCFGGNRNINFRAYNTLKRMGVNTIPELESKCACEIRDQRNVGKLTVDNILAALKAYTGRELEPCRSCKEKMAG